MAVGVGTVVAFWPKGEQATSDMIKANKAVVINQCLGAWRAVIVNLLRYRSLAAFSYVTIISSFLVFGKPLFSITRSSHSVLLCEPDPSLCLRCDIDAH